QLKPALLRFAHPVLNGQKPLLPAFVHSDQHQRTQPLVLSPQSGVDAVGPHVNPPLLAQRLAPPRLVFFAPASLKPGNHRCRQALRLRPHQRRQRLAHVAGGHPMQIQPRQRRIDRLRPAHIRRHQRRAEHRRLRDARPSLRHPHTYRPQPRQYLAPRLPAVAHHRHAPLVIAALGELLEMLVKLGLQRLGNQPLRAFTQHRAQQILPLWLAQSNYRILLHGWRDSLRGWLKTTSTIAFQQVTPPSSTHRSYTRFSYTSERERWTGKTFTPRPYLTAGRQWGGGGSICGIM